MPSSNWPGRAPRTGDVPDSGGEPTQVVITIPLRTLTEGLGTARLPDGSLLAPTTARRMACDCKLIPAVLGAEGAVLRRSLLSRVQAPGCGRGAALDPVQGVQEQS